MAGAGSIRKKKAVDTDVLTLTRERVRYLFEQYDTVAVSFSGGKDSTATLNMVSEVAVEKGRKVPVIFFDEEAIVPETVEYVHRVSQRPELEFHWLCLPIKCRNACSRRHPFWYPWAPEDEAIWTRPLPDQAITDLPGLPRDRDAMGSFGEITPLLFPALEYGRTVICMGIRAQESITRHRAVAMRTQDNRPWIRPWTIETGMHTKAVNAGTIKHIHKAYPVYDWQTEDVWTAPAQFGWDYNRAYDVMDKAGFSARDQRIGAAFGEEPVRALWYYQVSAPHLWDKMIGRVHGAATAARYATTSLYSFGKQRPQRPEGVTWPEFIRHWVDKHPDKYRGEIAGRVRAWMHNHYEKTSDPLACDAPHPDTGISWAMLLNIAVRGDYKDRRQAQYGQDYAKAQVRYNADIAAMRERGDL